MEELCLIVYSLTSNFSAIWWLSTLSPGHTALYSLIMAKARQNVISREADKIKSNNFYLK
jgi:hypothetical protein